MSLSPLEIMVIDDEPALSTLTKDFLEASGDIRVNAFDSVGDARAALLERGYDAIVCDFQMPEEDGLSFLRSLRANGDDTPFLLFTGKGREEVVIEALNHGADAYIQKGSSAVSTYAEMRHSIEVLVERHKARRMVYASESKFRALVDHTKEAVYLHEMGGKIVEVNDTAVHDSGYSRPELLNMSVFDIDPTLSMVPGRDEAWREMPLDKRLSFCSTHRHKDGHLYPIAVRIARISLAEEDYILSLAEDISLKDAGGEDLRNLMDGSPYGMMLWEGGGRILMANDAACCIMGRPKEVLLQTPFLKIASPEREGAVMELLRRALRESVATDVLELMDGSGRPNQCRISILCLGKDLFLGSVGPLQADR